MSCSRGAQPTDARTWNGGLPKAWVSDVSAPKTNESADGVKRAESPAMTGATGVFCPRSSAARDGGKGAAPRHLVVERALQDVLLVETKAKACRPLEGDGDELVLGEHAKLARARSLAEVRDLAACRRGEPKQSRETETAQRARRNDIALR